MRVVKADQPSVVRSMQGKRVVQSMRPPRARFHLSDFELQPKAAGVVVQMAVEGQQEFQRVCPALLLGMTYHITT